VEARKLCVVGVVVAVVAVVAVDGVVVVCRGEGEESSRWGTGGEEKVNERRRLATIPSAGCSSAFLTCGGVAGGL